MDTKQQQDHIHNMLQEYIDNNVAMGGVPINPSQKFWARFRCLTSDANLQIVAMERLQALLQEILQCERNYETQLRRVGSIRKDITKNIQQGTSNQGIHKDNQEKKHEMTNQPASDNHSNIYNLSIQSLQNYCLNKADLIRRDSIFLREKIFLTLRKTLTDQQKYCQIENDKGSSLVKQMKMLQRKIDQFKAKLDVQISEQKNPTGLISKIFKVKGGQDKKEIPKTIDPNSNISYGQRVFDEESNSKQVFNLMFDQINALKNKKKNYQQEIELLKSESEEFRIAYAKQMQEVIQKMEAIMRTNITQCEETFSNFYHYGNHKSESESKIVQSFKADFEKMSIVDRFQEYIDKEIPIFRPGWLCNEFENVDNLADSARTESIDIQFRRGSTIYLTDPTQQAHKGRPRPTLRRIHTGHGTEGGVIKTEEIKQDEQYLDQKSLETDFYKGLKKDIDKTLINAWEGSRELNQDEFRRFREVMRYKQGQELFIHLLNQFRVKRLFQINNQTAMNSLGELLSIVLDENYDCVDTSIPVNCHVLASTFYIKVKENISNSSVDGGQQTPIIKTHYLFELIVSKPIWQNINFWERSISQYIQFDIIQHKELEAQEALMSNQMAIDSLQEQIQNNHEKFQFENFNSQGQSVRSIIGGSSIAGSVSNLASQFSEENQKKLTEIVFAKLTQIQHDMLSFNVSLPQIKSLMNKYLKQSKIFPAELAKIIYDLLESEEKKQAIQKKQQLNFVNDDLFKDEFQANRDQRSTLFFGINSKQHSSKTQVQKQAEIERFTGVDQKERQFTQSSHVDRQQRVTLPGDTTDFQREPTILPSIRESVNLEEGKTSFRKSGSSIDLDTLQQIRKSTKLEEHNINIAIDEQLKQQRPKQESISDKINILDCVQEEDDPISPTPQGRGSNEQKIEALSNSLTESIGELNSATLVTQNSKQFTDDGLKTQTSKQFTDDGGLEQDQVFQGYQNSRLSEDNVISENEQQQDRTESNPDLMKEKPQNQQQSAFDNFKNEVAMMHDEHIDEKRTSIDSNKLMEQILKEDQDKIQNDNEIDDKN